MLQLISDHNLHQNLCHTLVCPETHPYFGSNTIFLPHRQGCSLSYLKSKILSHHYWPKPNVVPNLAASFWLKPKLRYLLPYSPPLETSFGNKTRQKKINLAVFYSPNTASAPLQASHYPCLFCVWNVKDFTCYYYHLAGFALFHVTSDCGTGVGMWSDTPTQRGLRWLPSLRE